MFFVPPYCTKQHTGGIHCECVRALCVCCMLIWVNEYFRPKQMGRNGRRIPFVYTTAYTLYTHVCAQTLLPRNATQLKQHTQTLIHIQAQLHQNKDTPSLLHAYQWGFHENSHIVIAWIWHNDIAGCPKRDMLENLIALSTDSMQNRFSLC